MAVTTVKQIVKPDQTWSQEISAITNVRSVELKLRSVPQNMVFFMVFDGENWSQEKALSKIREVQDFHIIKILVANKTEENVLVDIDVNIQYEEVKKPLADNKNVGLLRIDKFGDRLTNLESDMNLFINQNDGFQVEYVRTEATEEDIVLKEYTRKKVVDRKCLYVLTEDNILPSLEDAEVSEWALEFQSFQVEMSKLYFESVFGECTEPRDGDWCIISLIQTAFNISGVTPVRGVNGIIDRWKLTLSTYEKDESIEGSEFMDDEISNYEKMYSGDVEEEIEDVVNSLETMPSRIYGDVNRTYVSPNVVFGDKRYALGTGDKDAVAVKYQPVTKIGALSFNVIFYDDATLFDFDGKTINIENGKIKTSGAIAEYVMEIETKYGVVISFFSTYTAVQIVSGNKEVFFDDSLPPKTLSGTPKLLFGDIEIMDIMIAKVQIHRDRHKNVLSDTFVDKSGNFFVIDRCKEVLNLPRAKESNFRKNV